MKYLLDTPTLLWSRLEPSRLSKDQRGIFSDPDSQKLISTVTLWEISLKFGLGKLELGGHTPEDFVESVQQLGYLIVAPTPAILASYHRLPSVVGHKDPFDRLLVWQAINSKLKLVSADSKFSAYTPSGLSLA